MPSRCPRAATHGTAALRGRARACSAAARAPLQPPYLHRLELGFGGGVFGGQRVDGGQHRDRRVRLAPKRVVRRRQSAAACSLGSAVAAAHAGRARRGPHRAPERRRRPQRRRRAAMGPGCAPLVVGCTGFSRSVCCPDFVRHASALAHVAACAVARSTSVQRRTPQGRAWGAEGAKRAACAAAHGLQALARAGAGGACGAALRDGVGHVHG